MKALTNDIVENGYSASSLKTTFKNEGYKTTIYFIIEYYKVNENDIKIRRVDEPR